jgi:hypothetical protein
MKELKHKIAGKLAVLLGRIAVKLSAYADASRADAHIRITVAIADWPAETADCLIAHGATPAETARAFADALRAERVQ